MTKTDVTLRWGAVCAIVAGVTMLLPLIFYFYLLPDAGSSATHAQDPASFLPWMVEHGNVRQALWWSVCLPFLVAPFGVPQALKKRLESFYPPAPQIAELAGVLGFFTFLLATLVLVAGEMPLAREYVAAGEQARPAIVATYEWQRLVTALIFDGLGFFLIGVWIFVSSVVGLRSGELPRGLGRFGVVTALTCFSFAVGYVTGIKWLGETGVGVLAFLAIPVWLVWLGRVLWQTERMEK